LLTEHLKVDHLRLVMGTSMGAMHTWMWGYTYPDFMDALMPLASLPVEIAGRNRIQRKMAIKLIEMDPEWKGGEYTAQPKVGLSGAILSLMFMVSSPLQWQKSAPTREKAELMMDRMLNGYAAALDANDMIYAFDSSRDYNPSPYLSKIKAPLFAVNSADDQVNPPELGLMEREITKVKNGKYILLPITDKTSGHGTHSDPTIWGNYLQELLSISAPKAK
jgi:homoserine O-acetyltransferase